MQRAGEIGEDVVPLLVLHEAKAMIESELAHEVEGAPGHDLADVD